MPPGSCLLTDIDLLITARNTGTSNGYQSFVDLSECNQLLNLCMMSVSDVKSSACPSAERACLWCVEYSLMCSLRAPTNFVNYVPMKDGKLLVFFFGVAARDRQNPPPVILLELFEHYLLVSFIHMAPI